MALNILIKIANKKWKKRIVSSKTLDVPLGGMAYCDVLSSLFAFCLDFIVNKDYALICDTATCS